MSISVSKDRDGYFNCMPVWTVAVENWAHGIGIY